MAAWRAWRALRDRDDVVFDLVDLPPGWGPGIVADYGDVHVILIDRALDPVERLAVLAHELVHIERGGVAHCLDVEKEERTVDRIVAARLVPAEDLEALVDLLVELEGGVTAEMVAEEFEVTPTVARRAMLELLRRHEARRAG